jgi:hypothetical protein
MHMRAEQLHFTMAGRRAGHPVASVRERIDSFSAPTRGGWVAGSSPAMVRYFCISVPPRLRVTDLFVTAGS